MAQTVLITGASSGIGKGYAYEFGKRGYNLILVARNQNKLTEIQSDLIGSYSISVHLFIMDLSEIDAASSLLNQVKTKDLSVDILINNAGFSTKGLFDSSDFGVQRREMILNMVTLTELAYLFTKEWSGKSDKAIINVASASAFQSTPYNAVYGSTKAYVLSLTEALHVEYQDKGIYHLAVCPGPTDTAFFDDIGDFDFSRKRTVEDVVATTFKAMAKKKVIAMDGWFTKLRAQAPRILSRKRMTQIGGAIAGKYWNEG